MNFNYNKVVVNYSVLMRRAAELIRQSVGSKKNYRHEGYAFGHDYSF
jgi:hypothetical protein